MSKLDELTIGELKEATALLSGNNGIMQPPVPFDRGQSYFIRTVTYHLVGRVRSIVGSFLVLDDASWVADSGRFMQALQDGTLSEVEPVGMALLNISAITDAFPWKHNLPKEQK